MTRLSAVAAAAVLLGAPLAPAAPPESARQVLDAFADASGWIAAPSDGVSMKLSPDRGEPGGALRVDFDFGGHAGWAASRKAFPVALPANWAFSVRLRGESAPQTLEFKLLDRSGENVWWSVKRDLAFPNEWTTLRFPKRRVAFAWGPGDRNAPLTELGFVEITVTAASGGKGTLWIDELALEALPPEGSPLPPPRSWTGDPSKGEQQDLVLDLGGRRELGGLSLEWDARDFPKQYEIALSSDGTSWEPPRSVRTERGGRAWIALPDAQAAYVRLRTLESARGGGYRLREVRVEPPEFSDTPTKFLESVAHASPRGQWPRQLVAEQVYWSIVGVSGGRDKALLSEDGVLETGRGAFTLEPIMVADGSLLGWDGADIRHSLEDGDLPLPSVTRSYAGGLSLEVAAFADGPPDASVARVRYRIQNTGPHARRVFFAVCLRPVQVNPPWQWLNVPGGFAPLRSLSGSALEAVANGSQRVAALTRVDSFQATDFDHGEIVSRLVAFDPPATASAEDPGGFASGALYWRVDLAGTDTRDFVLAIPLSPGGIVERPDDPSADYAARRAAAARTWRDALGGISFTLPPEAQEIVRAARTNLGWILMQRDGPAIQPGSRAYARSWIRDGSLTSTALLRMGRPEEAREFLRWFATFELTDGAVPCCVDRRGADPVPENDSHGELCYLANTYFRYTGDRATVDALWPRVARAAEHIDRLRQSRRTEEYRTGPKRAFYGLLPESISHEGYSDKPMHSYWDDFWALRGLSDAADLAAALGRAKDAERIRKWLDEMRDDVHASIRRVIAEKRLDFIPGSAELGDFDATSTTIALDPCGEASRLPQRELENTFERYWHDFVARREDRAKAAAGAPGAGAYTPYEWRVAGSLVRLGRRDRAKELFDFFLADRRPREWNHWAEVVFPGVRDPKSMGDMPHGWVGSDFIRAFLDLFAYERVEDGALVLGAGLPSEWLVTETGAGVNGLRTPWGALDLSFKADAQGLHARIGGAMRVPPGGFVIPWPLAGKTASARVNGRTVAATERGEIVVREVPAEIEAPAR